MDEFVAGTHKIITLGVVRAFRIGSIIPSEGEPTGDPATTILRTWTIDAYMAKMPPISVSLVKGLDGEHYLDFFMDVDDDPQVLGVPVDPDRVAAALGEIVRLYNERHR